jgi:SpoVK/Ycf46/Vps4 family AAA+-type ATPase
MRPEIMRKGRFGRSLFCGFPTLEERIDILKKKIQKYDREVIPFLIFLHSNPMGI